MTGRSAAALNTVLALLLVLGVAGYVRSDHQVLLTVDGAARAVSSHADNVGALLADEGLETGWRDVVAPAPDTELVDGMHVVVRFARPVALGVDGQPVRVWTTALTVDEALATLGMRVQTASLSTSRAATIPRTGVAVDVRLPDLVTFMHDGRRTTLLTAADTVRGAMREAGLRLGGRDRSDAALSARVHDGMVVTLTRVDIRVVRQPFRIHRALIRRADDTLYEGQQEVVRSGRHGRGVFRVQLTVADGVVVRRIRLSREVLRRPIDRVVAYGTKARVFAPPGTPIGDLNWGALAQCESGGNPAAVNPAGYYGLYQFDLSTWASVGGAGNPTDASPAEQLYRAQLLYGSRGAAPWPVCGVLLYT